MPRPRLTLSPLPFPSLIVRSANEDPLMYTQAPVDISLFVMFALRIKTTNLVPSVAGLSTASKNSSYLNYYLKSLKIII